MDNEKSKDEIVEAKVKEKKKDGKKAKVIVTSRVLFISVLDKIYLTILGLVFVFGTISVFSGPISSLGYGFFKRVFLEFVLIVILIVLYLFLNWFYNCAVKTILCLTKAEVYREHYFPFKRSEDSIPLEKITKVSTLNLFWIFRAVIICQYHRFPLIFWTWNNQEFKDKLVELITNNKEKNLLNESMHGYLMYIILGLLIVILLIGIIKFGFFAFGNERRIAGTYYSSNNIVVLNKDGSCDLEGFSNNIRSCFWSYISKSKEVEINYQYSYYYSYYDNNVIRLKYDKNNNTLNYEGLILKK